MEIAIGTGVLLSMVLAAAAGRSMWLAKRRHEQDAIARHELEMAALRAAIGELVKKYTAAADQANSFNEDVKSLVERAGREIAALRTLIGELDTKYTAAASRVNNLADDVNEETKRLLAEHDNALSEKVASLTARLDELKERFNVTSEEIVKRLSDTKVAVIPPTPRLLPVWKVVAAGVAALMALLCGLAFGEEQIQSLNQRLDRAKIDFDGRLDRLDSLKTDLERRLDRAKTDFEWRLDRLERRD
jgi:DNA repair exonuclease SbcCD ATPase subunit